MVQFAIRNGHGFHVFGNFDRTNRVAVLVVGFNGRATGQFRIAALVDDNGLVIGCGNCGRVAVLIPRFDRRAAGNRGVALLIDRHIFQFAFGNGHSFHAFGNCDRASGLAVPVLILFPKKSVDKASGRMVY